MSYNTQKISRKQTLFHTGVQALSIPNPQQQTLVLYWKALLALLLTLSVLLANLSIVYANETGTVSNVYTVLLNDTERYDLPRTVTVGDEVVWKNNSDNIIVLERSSGFRLFLPLVQSKSNLGLNNPVAPPTRNETLGTSVEAWVILPGDSLAMSFDQSNFYTFKINGQTTQELELQVNAQ